MTDPKVEWKDGRIHVSLPQPGTNAVIDASWVPAGTYVVKIRRAGDESWGPGFEIPFTGCRFVDLDPDTEYEMQVEAKNTAGLRSAPVVQKVRTNPEGDAELVN